MSEVIGKVASLDGIFYIKAEDGSLRQLNKGSDIYLNDVIVGADDNSRIDSIIVSLDDGTDVVLLAQEEQLFDASLLNIQFSEDETVNEASVLEQLVAVATEEQTDVNEEEIYTEASDGSVDATTAIEATFQEIQDNTVDIIAELRDIQTSTDSLDTNINDDNSDAYLVTPEKPNKPFI
ncbi:MAG: hypothetical protein IE881_09365 [Epsilonproteobacteria bacterium]|nr:hypothetical protein [Campylobacterota bacterium]